MTSASSNPDPAPDSSATVRMPRKTRPEKSSGHSQVSAQPTDDGDEETPQNRPKTEAFDSRYLQVSPYGVDDGNLIGRDPRTIPTADVKALGHPPNFKKAVRMKCLDCVGTELEVRKCVQFSCPLWHMRMGNNPLHGKS